MNTPDYSVLEIIEWAWNWADRMLSERASHIPDAGKKAESQGEKYRAWVAQNAAIVKAAKEKAASNHDVAPAARAEPSESSVPLGKGQGTGNTGGIDAWMIIGPEDIHFSFILPSVLRPGFRAVALYSRPPLLLSDRERDALHRAALRADCDELLLMEYREASERCRNDALAIRGLVERAK